MENSHILPHFTPIRPLMSEHLTAHDLDRPVFEIVRSRRPDSVAGASALLVALETNVETCQQLALLDLSELMVCWSFP
jgi:hypothetical protein